MVTLTRIMLDPRLLAGSGTLPPDISDTDDDIDPGPSDPHDYEDLGMVAVLLARHGLRLGHWIR
jgi:hypothetical protein